MILQLIVWAPTREKAIVRMQRALNDTIITGKTSLDCFPGKAIWYQWPATICCSLRNLESVHLRIDVPKFE